jgi:hypothetical protein
VARALPIDDALSTADENDAALGEDDDDDTADAEDEDDDDHAGNAAAK